MANHNAKSSFLGRGWRFPPSFNRREGAVQMSEDEQDIHESLQVLFGTRLAERSFAPRYGLSMQEWLFKPIGTTEASLLREQITLAILIYEPRVDVLSLRVNTTRLAEGQLLIELDYKVKATNSRYNLVYPYYLGDGSEVSLPAAPLA